MKKIIIPFLATQLVSCAVSSYYQVYKAIPENGTLNGNEIVFEDKNCRVSYNLWTEGGNVGFTIFNKTENDITINLKKTFFILNGQTFDYFQNRTFSKSFTNASIVTSYVYPNWWNYDISKEAGINSSSNSISSFEKSERTIPAKTFIRISEYHITNNRLVVCDLNKYPSGNDRKTVNFERTNSPFVFYNLITYSSKRDTVRLENKFYVSEISNLPETKMQIRVDTTLCGKKLPFPIQVLKNGSANEFFIKYPGE